MVGEIYCLVCDKLVKMSYVGSAYGAVIFTADGNYGSTVIDHSFSDFGVDEFHLAICDDCLKLKSDKIISIRDPNRHRQREERIVTGTLKEAIERGEPYYKLDD